MDTVDKYWPLTSENVISFVDTLLFNFIDTGGQIFFFKAKMLYCVWKHLDTATFSKCYTAGNSLFFGGLTHAVGVNNNKQRCPQIGKRTRKIEMQKNGDL